MASSPPALPPEAAIDFAHFDPLQEDPACWREVVAAIAARYSPAPMVPAGAGTVLVGLVGQDLVVKLYPPFLRDHFEFEAALLPRLQGRLGVPTPALIDRGEHEGWPFLVMTRLAGEPLDRLWPTLDEAARCTLLHQIGRLAAEVHALPVDGQAALAPAWGDFVQRQRAGCRRRQERVRLPAHLLAQLDGFIAGPLPEGPDVILTGEYTPMNLLAWPAPDVGLAGMYDFGDGLVGPREYDWLGPLCFLAAGHRARVDALLTGLGEPTDRSWRLPLLRLLLLHRYSSPLGQIALPAWHEAPSFEAAAALIWP